MTHSSIIQGFRRAPAGAGTGATIFAAAGLTMLVAVNVWKIAPYVAGAAWIINWTR